MDKEPPTIPSTQLIVVPARLASVRLPRKMLADIGGKSLIAHVVERVGRAAQAVPRTAFVIATDDEAIAAEVKQAGGEYVMTDPALPSGTDRTFAAWQMWAEAHDASALTHVVNIQGDMPFIAPEHVEFLLHALPRAGEFVAGSTSQGANILTLAAPLCPDDWRRNAVVKIFTSLTSSHAWAQAYAFSRSAIPCPDAHGSADDDGAERIGWEHIGVYAYHVSALQAFVAQQPSLIEKAEKLEQWRAIEAGMRIDVGRVDHAPIAIDTPADLQAARAAWDEQ